MAGEAASGLLGRVDLTSGLLFSARWPLRPRPSPAIVHRAAGFFRNLTSKAPWDQPQGHPPRPPGAPARGGGGGGAPHSMSLASPSADKLRGVCPSVLLRLVGQHVRTEPAWKFPGHTPCGCGRKQWPSQATNSPGRGPHQTPGPCPRHVAAGPAPAPRGPHAPSARGHSTDGQRHPPVRHPTRPKPSRHRLPWPVSSPATLWQGFSLSLVWEPPEPGTPAPLPGSSVCSPVPGPRHPAAGSGPPAVPPSPLLPSALCPHWALGPAPPHPAVCAPRACVHGRLQGHVAFRGTHCVSSGQCEPRAVLSGHAALGRSDRTLEGVCACGQDAGHGRHPNTGGPRIPYHKYTNVGQANQLHKAPDP